MSSFINKLASSVTNTTGSILGRDNLTKLSNSINKGLFIKSKYRNHLRAGNTVQLISKTSHMSLQICQSRNDPNRLVLLGNGQIGAEFLNTHFTIEYDEKSKHYKFRNLNNYICYDNEIPCVLFNNPNPKNNFEAIRARNEFRLHELIGSDEYFALESVYFPGRYLAVLADGSLTSTKNKGDEKAHFCLNGINILPENMRPQSSMGINQNRNAAPVVPVTVGAAGGPMVRESSLSNFNTQKEQESIQPRYEPTGDPMPVIAQSTDLPPAYSNIYPKLPN